MKIILKLIFVAQVIASSTCAQSNSSWSKIRSGSSDGKVYISYFESPGIIEGSPEKVSGLAVDILNDFVEFVSRKYKLKISLVYVAREPGFNEFLTFVEKTPNVLGVGGISVTEERKSRFEFTPGFIKSPNVLITNKDYPTITDVKGLSRLTPVALESGSQIPLIRQLQKKYLQPADIIYKASPLEVLEKISVSKNDFTILGLNDFLNGNRKRLNIRMQKIDLGAPEVFSFIMKKGSDWVVPWDEFLTVNYTKSEKYKNMVAKNLGSVYLKALNENL